MTTASTENTGGRDAYFPLHTPIMLFVYFLNQVQVSPIKINKHYMNLETDGDISWGLPSAKKPTMH